MLFFSGRGSASSCLKKHNLKTLVLAGGVSANLRLRELASEEGAKAGIKVLYPPLRLCTDNAAMIASSGYFAFIEGKNMADNLTLVPSSVVSL